MFLSKVIFNEPVFNFLFFLFKGPPGIPGPPGPMGPKVCHIAPPAFFFQILMWEVLLLEIICHSCTTVHNPYLLSLG